MSLLRCWIVASFATALLAVGGCKPPEGEGDKSGTEGTPGGTQSTEESDVSGKPTEGGDPAKTQEPPASSTPPAEPEKPAGPEKATAPEQPTAPEKPAAPHPALTDPSLAKEQAPDVFQAKFETSQGDFVVEVHRDWAPRGADRFYNLVRIGFFDDIRFFRVLNSPPHPFMAQFGINGDPAVSSKWTGAPIQDDPVEQSNKRGFITFATSGPNSRTTQVFISYSDNSRLDKDGFAPFGQVVEGMNVVDSLHGGYGEGRTAPNQGLIQSQGNAYLEAQFPKLDFVNRATILE
ncbi:MAG: peptidylprolyl isomerase [Planctomycetota bacterium]|nr:peptidylprolyl isomerase [Planctomycetota bacterium]